MKKWWIPAFNFLISLFILSLFLFSSSALFSQKKKNELKKEDEKNYLITEEIIVTAPAPRNRWISTVSVLDKIQVEYIKPRDLSEAVQYLPGSNVSLGSKSFYTLKLRGIDSRRIALLVDGIPVYEPFFSTFDLKNISVQGIENLKINKGPSSVLYGPNTLGGIVNVITRRPEDKPALSAHFSYGQGNTNELGLQSSLQFHEFSLVSSLLYQGSDGYYYPDEQSGELEKRVNSQYQRTNLQSKLYYHPSNQTEILVDSNIYLSRYSMPPGLGVYRPRYWQFKNWDRCSFSLGGYTCVGKDSTFGFRAYLVHYDNTLDMYEGQEMTMRRFESTYHNSVYGLFSLTDIKLSPDNRFKFSLNYKGDVAHTQDDVGQPWSTYNQGTLSLGVEDHFTFAPDWKIVGGVSFDYLDKFKGKSISSINPLLGINYSPSSFWGVHASFSKKSKFPSMRSMYSSYGGNPDLLSESGINLEVGWNYEKGVHFSGAVFWTEFRDMIDSVRLPQYDFRRVFLNIGKAHIHGLEIQLKKSLSWISSTLNYTFLKHRNEADDRLLDALPPHNLNFSLQIFPLSSFRLGIMGVWASSSSWWDYEKEEVLDIPSYFNLDTVFSYKKKGWELFLKMTNLLNQYIYTEPGFPWRGRYFELGVKVKILK